MSALRTTLRPALTPALGSARRGVSRYFTTFDAVAQSYVQLNSIVSLTGDFSIQVDVSVPDVSAISIAAMILGNSSGTANAMWVTSAGNVVIRDSEGTTRTSEPAITSGKLHRITYVKTAGNIVGFVDGVEVYSSAPFASFIFNQIGVRQDTSFNFNGIIANVKIEDNDTTVLDMPIDKNYTPTNNTVIDLASGNNGTFVNIAAGRSKYYQHRADGNFVDLQGNVLEVAY